MKPERVLLVLSGGGAKATAHLGAMRALIEQNLEPAHIIGTSMGAVIGAGLAAGMTPEEMLQRMEGVERHDIAAIDPVAVIKGVFAHAWFKDGPFRETLARMLPVQTFAELKLPLTVTTTDLDSGDLVCFGTGGEDAPLVDTLYASCALPLLYPPGLDFIAGRQSRAPKLLRENGLEWAWRLASNPRRLGVRYARCAALMAELSLAEGMGLRGLRGGRGRNRAA